MSSNFKKLYTGVTTRLMHRVADHKSCRNSDSFTSRYKIDKLVYYECHASVVQAIARETQIKGWLRIKKIELIVGLNPEWRDLSLDWGKPIEAFDESKLRLPETLANGERNKYGDSSPSPFAALRVRVRMTALGDIGTPVKQTVAV